MLLPIKMLLSDIYFFSKKILEISDFLHHTMTKVVCSIYVLLFSSLLVALVYAWLMCANHCSLFAANLPAASQPVVSSFSYYYLNCALVCATRCCFTCWRTNAGSYVPNSGRFCSQVLGFAKKGKKKKKKQFKTLLLIKDMFCCLTHMT